MIRPGALEAARPGLEGRYEFFHNFDEDRRIEIAPGFHTSTTHAGGLLDSVASLLARLVLQSRAACGIHGAFYAGENVAPLGNGYAAGILRSMDGIWMPVHSMGGWGQITVHALPRLDLHLFTGQQDDQEHRSERRPHRQESAVRREPLLPPRAECSAGTGSDASSDHVYRAGLRINNHYDLALAYIFSAGLR